MSAGSDIAQRRAQARESGPVEYHQRRAELVEAAAQVFRRKGYRAANLQDIAAVLGMERASLYYYVSGKDELFRDVVLAAVRDNVAMAADLNRSDGRADARLARFIAQLMQSYERHYPYLFVYVQENMAQIDDGSAWGREMRRLGKQFDEAVRGIVQQGLDEGSLKSPTRDARLIANGVIGMCNWSHRWFHPEGEGAGAAVGAVFAAMVIEGLAAKSEQDL